jgi:hypothetical protein
VIFDSNLCNSVVVKRTAFTKVVFKIKLSEIFDFCDNGTSIKYHEALVNLIFNVEIQVSLIKFFV